MPTPFAAMLARRPRRSPATVAARPAALPTALTAALTATLLALPACQSSPDADAASTPGATPAVPTADAGQGWLNLDALRSRPPLASVAVGDRTFLALPALHRKTLRADTVIEWFDPGEYRPYPDRLWQHYDPGDSTGGIRHFVNPVALDRTREVNEVKQPRDYLWVLDNGRAPVRDRVRVVPAGLKLVRIDTRDDRVVHTYYIDGPGLTDQARFTDFAVDPEHAVAYLADATRPGLFVFDLQRVRGWYALWEHASLHATVADATETASNTDTDNTDATATATATGDAIVPEDGAGGAVAHVALSPNGEWLYYAAEGGAMVYRVPTDTLREANVANGAVAATVQACAATPGPVTALAVHPAGAILVAQRDGTLSTHQPGTFAATTDAAAWQTLVALPVGGGQYVSDLSFDASGSLRVCVTSRTPPRGPSKAVWSTVRTQSEPGTGLYRVAGDRVASVLGAWPSPWPLAVTPPPTHGLERALAVEAEAYAASRPLRPFDADVPDSPRGEYQQLPFAPLPETEPWLSDNVWSDPTDPTNGPAPSAAPDADGTSADDARDGTIANPGVPHPRLTVSPYADDDDLLAQPTDPAEADADADEVTPEAEPRLTGAIDEPALMSK